MTLVEFIVVAVLICVLVALLLPVTSERDRKRTPIVQARKDMADLRSAIDIFRNDYSRFPIPTRIAALTNADFTFGTVQTTLAPSVMNGVQANNSEIMQFLLGSGAPAGTTPNPDVALLNPKRIQYFNARRADDTNSPGLGPDLVMCDPWGNPYIITLDLDGDGKCTDAFYRLASVSRNPPPSHRPALTNAVGADPLKDDFAIPGSVVIWSFGPDGKIDPTQWKDAGANRDNVVSWR